MLRKAAKVPKKARTSSNFIPLLSPVGNNVDTRALPYAARRQPFHEAGRKTHGLSKEGYIPSLGRKEMIQFDEHFKQHTTNILG
jgi:hypothetical protein